jgi:hypothetical protein
LLKLAILISRDRGKAYTKRGVELKPKEKNKNTITFKKEGGDDNLDIVLDLHADGKKPAEARISFVIEKTLPYDHLRGEEKVHAAKNMSVEKAEELVKELTRLIELGKKFEKEY